MQAGRWKRRQLSGRHPLFLSIRPRAQVRARAPWHPVQRPSEQRSQSRHSNCRGKADEHHRLPKSVTVVRRGERTRMTTTVMARKPPLPEGRLSRCRRHEIAEAVQGARAVCQKELMNDSNGTTYPTRILRKMAPQLGMTNRKSPYPEGAVDVPDRIRDRSSHCELTARPPPPRAPETEAHSEAAQIRWNRLLRDIPRSVPELCLIQQVDQERAARVPPKLLREGRRTSPGTTVQKQLLRFQE